MKRREFVVSAAAAALPFRTLRSAVPRRAAPTDDETGATVRPFALSQVRLTPGPFLDAAEVNRRYLMSMDPDRLLHMFRVTAGLPSQAAPLGGWEAPENELRGHYMGHYLSALASRWTGAGDAEARDRGARIVGELAKCQAALGNGYLSAFPIEFFDRLRDGKRVWAPWYTLHKIMAGLLDQHVHCANAQALDVLQRMVGWTRGWVAPLSESHMRRVLLVEFGGMNELLYNLSAVTGNRGDLWLAHRFDDERLFAPLAAGRDELRGLHVNTQIPKVVGAARRYELTGDDRYRRIAEYFWREVTAHRAYCTGGTSNGEAWRSDPDVLSTELSGYTQESCTTYNMLKLTRHLFEWTADPVCADYYERALFNGILGCQHPADGSKLYYTPLASGFWRLFGTPMHDFWCCTGTMSESFATLNDAIYFHDDDGVYVNLFIPSELDWTERSVRLTQETEFPREATSTIRVHAARPTRFALRVRVPSWTSGGAATLNGRRLDGFAGPGGYYVLDRTWRDGDRVEVTLPMRLHMSPMPDDPSVQAVMYGPLVLAGRLGTEGLTADTVRGDATAPRSVPEYRLEPVAAPALLAGDSDPNRWIEPSQQHPLEFRAAGSSHPVTLAPLHGIFDERYAVYWRMTSGAHAQ